MWQCSGNIKIFFIFGLVDNGDNIAFHVDDEAELLFNNDILIYR